MTLTEFLLARIAEDAAAVEGFWSGDGDPDFMWGPGRIRVECEAKRRIVERVGQQADYLLDDHDDDLEGGWSEAVYMAADVLTTLALPYADHPDCREEWKP